MKRYLPVLAALSIGAVSTGALAAGPYTATTPPPAVRTSTTVVGSPDSHGMLSNTAVTGTFDTTLGRKFTLEREIVDRAASVYGKSATFASGDNLPSSIDRQIVAGDMLPPRAPTKPVPSALGDLPTLDQGDHWVAAGEHLIEVAPDNRIAMVIYDVLP